MLTLLRRRRSGAQRTSAQEHRSTAEALVQKSHGENPAADPARRLTLHDSESPDSLQGSGDLP